MHFFIGHPPKIYSPTHIDLLPDNCPESSSANNNANASADAHRPMDLCPRPRPCLWLGYVLARRRVELWVANAAGDRLNAIFHCNSNVFLVFSVLFFRAGFHQRISIKFRRHILRRSNGNRDMCVSIHHWRQFVWKIMFFNIGKHEKCENNNRKFLLTVTASVKTILPATRTTQPLPKNVKEFLYKSELCRCWFKN